MARVVNAREIMKDLCDMWGFKSVRKMDIHLELDCVGTLEVTHLLLDTDGVTLVEVLKKYDLVEKKEIKEE